MALSPGIRLGPYEVLSALGAGGMGEVYRARDTKLNRDVALKVLPDLAVSDKGGAQVRWQPDGKALFYIALDDRLMAVPLGFSSTCQVVEPGAPVGLFVTNVRGALQPFPR